MPPALNLLALSKRAARGAAMVVSLVLAAGAGACGATLPEDLLAVPQGQAPEQAMAQLEGLTVASWTTMAGYSRELFPHWSSQGNGCDTRDLVLERDGAQVRVEQPCTVTGGTWFSVYDGQTVTDPRDVDIDHMVPLANAWRTGASSWDDQRREDFANDLTRPQLIAVTASSNRSKGDQDPSQWRPRQAYWCEYAKRWVDVKSHWDLSVTATEKTTLVQMLGTC